MNTFNFNNRESYITFRNRWWKEYQEISNEIRKQKAIWTEARHNGRTYTNYILMRKRLEANAMMQLLEEVKQESARQWAANREGAAS